MPPPLPHRLLAGLLLTLVAGTGVSDTIDPDDEDFQWGWSENLGHLNHEPLGDGGVGVVVLEGAVRGWVWSPNAGWVSLSCDNTSSCDTVRFGVTHDGTGTLSGWAWGENVGWISLGCTNTGTCEILDYGVSIDQTSGHLSGWAWGENIGWISFNCTNTGTCATANFKVRTTTPFPVAALFSDGFESGDLAAWSATVP